MNRYDLSILTHQIKVPIESHNIRSNTFSEYPYGQILNEVFVLPTE
jgi:hypothetical protein